MNQMDILDFWPFITIENGGYFVSHGVGSHPKRVISSWELIVVRQGTLDIYEEDAHYSVKENEALLLAPRRLHWGEKSYEKDLKFFWLHFTINTPKNQSLPIQKYSKITHPTRISQLFRWLLEDQEEGIKENYKPFLLAILVELTRGKYDKGLSNIPYLAQQAHIIIRSEYATNISTNQIASSLKCNPDYLGRVYKKYFNKTIIQSLHGKRIQAAKELLDKSSLNINEVAIHVGFNDSDYFRRVFKEHLGITPSSYRKSFTEIHINTK